MPDMIDITEPKHGVQVQISDDGKVLWVHVDGVTVLRIYRIPRLDIEDARFNPAREMRTLADARKIVLGHDRYGSSSGPGDEGFGLETARSLKEMHDRIVSAALQNKDDSIGN